MVIGVDMDSVIAEIIRPLDRFHNKKYLTNLSYEDHVVYDLSIVWNCSGDEVFKRIFEYYDSEEFLSVTPVEGSQKALIELSKKHSLHLITSRPYDIEEQSHKWLKDYFPRVFTSTTHTNQVSKGGKGKGNKKSLICKRLKTDIMIDDHIEYALDCANNKIKTLLFPAPWNKKYAGHNRYLKQVNGWSDIMKML